MILESIRVREYKNIKDTGDVGIRDSVTCLVGKNESGKTSLLEALYRLNPVTTGHPESFVALRDYPRRRYARDREQVPGTRPISATFMLEEADVRAVEDAHGHGVLASRRVTVSRSYDNEVHWEIECRGESGRRADAMPATRPRPVGSADEPTDARAGKGRARQGQGKSSPPRHAWKRIAASATACVTFLRTDSPAFCTSTNTA